VEWLDAVVGCIAIYWIWDNTGSTPVKHLPT
jgi:hypothetical protein